MNFNKAIPALLLAISIISCQKDEIDTIVKDKIEGYVQKGPYINGTAITISELNSKLIPTGRNFITQIVDNKGSFQVNNISLNSQFIELKADGFYFNEVTGNTSIAPLTLYALTDISDKSSINVNVLSYLEKGRIEYLISQGKNFAESKKQAQQEVLNIFEIQKADIRSSETLDLSQPGDDNAILLASSVILQGNRSVAELSELLANISIDIKEDGILYDANLGSKLINEIKYMDLTKVRQNIEKRYVDLGVAVSIPNFEKYVRSFIDNTDFDYNLPFYYPESGTYGVNILSIESNSILNSRKEYSASAIVPANSSLKIIIRNLDDVVYAYNSSSESWKQSIQLNSYGMYESGSSFTLTAMKTGEIIDIPINFHKNGKCQIEYYENGSPQPTLVKTINWIDEELFTYPTNGSYGENLLSLATASRIVAKEYSLAVSLPDDDEYTTNISISFSPDGPFYPYTIDPDRIQNWQITQSRYNLTLKASGKGITADLPITLHESGMLTISGGMYESTRTIYWQ